MTGSRNRPLVFAHRGAKLVAPENTLPAFQAAIDCGAEGIELDIQYSSDGGLVVYHNPNLGTTSDGAGRVTAHTLADLRALDAGSWFDPRFAGTQIPILDEVLDLTRGKLLLNIELKAFDAAGNRLGVDVVERVRAQRMADQVILSSFNPLVLRAALRAAPEMTGALLVAPDLPGWTRWEFTRRYSRARDLHPELAMADAVYLARARKLGCAVRVWTVDEEDDLRRMAALGVDAIITDDPQRALALLQVS